MCPGLDLSEPKRRWLSWGQGLRPTSGSLEFEGGNESAKHNCSEWNQRKEELGRPGLAPRSPGAGGYSCGKLQALGSG